MSLANRTHAGRPSLVDGAEHAVRDWLAPGRFREGDRLPTEQELASMLGVSRGTLRTALSRLEDSGEIVRRQGSGTYVGRISGPGQGERLRRVESYRLRLPHGALQTASLEIERRPAGEVVAGHLKLARPEVEVTLLARVVESRSGRAALCHDYLAPRVRLPGEKKLRCLFGEGATSFDVLVSCARAVSTSRSTITARTVAPDHEYGRPLALTAPTSCLVLEEVVYDTASRPLMFSCDVMVPAEIELEILQSVDVAAPEPIDH